MFLFEKLAPLWILIIFPQEIHCCFLIATLAQLVLLLFFILLLLLLFEQLSYAKHLFDFITSDSKLPSLLKMLPWAKNRVDEKAAYTPVNHLSTATLEDPALWMLLALQLQFGTLRIYTKMLRSGMKNYVSFYPTGLVSNPS